MSLEQLETKVKTLEGQQEKTYELWVGVDKKLDILINSNEFVNKASAEFRSRAEEKIEKLEAKVVDLEKTALLSGQSLKQFELVRDTIVKKVAGLVLIALLSVGTMSAMVVAYMSK